MNTHKINKYYDLAYNTAMNIDRATKHVSMIFLGNQLVAIGINDKSKTHPLAKEYGYLFNNMHSELAAWLQVRHMDYNKMVLVNWHFNNQGDIKLARPCKKCLHWAVAVFKEIWYTTPLGWERL